MRRSILTSPCPQFGCVSPVGSPLQTLTQASAPKSSLTAFSSRLLPAKTVSSGTSISGGSIVSAAVGSSSSSSAYDSNDAVSRLNQDLLDAQAQNEAARQRQLQEGGGTGSTLPGGADLIQSQTDNMALLKLQIAMQRENQYFTTISNILKTRHETLKTIIGNIR